MSYFQTGERPSSVVYLRISHYFLLIPTFLFRTAYQSLHKASNQARLYNYIANNGLTHDWLEHYRNIDIRSNQLYINEWNQMDDISSHQLSQPYVIISFSNFEEFLLDYHPMKKYYVLKYMLN
jgi:hypothetical protein